VVVPPPSPLIKDPLPPQRYHLMTFPVLASLDHLLNSDEQVPPGSWTFEDADSSLLEGDDLLETLKTVLNQV